MSAHDSSQWQSSPDANDDWIDIPVGFFPKNVVVMAQIAKDDGTYGDNYTQIQPASLENLKKINSDSSINELKNQ